MDYTNARHVTVIFVTVGILSVESLIGLRPPQHKTKDDKRQPDAAHVDPQSLMFQQPTVKEGTMCYSPELFRCSSLLLRRSVWNESSPCNRINSFRQCSAAALAREGRRQYMRGVNVMRKLTDPFYQKHNCPAVNVKHNQTHHRHLQAKEAHSDDCCITTLLTCSVQTFLDSLANTAPNKCEMLARYKQCLNTSSSSCQWKSFTEKLPGFTTLTLNCPTRKRRRL